MLKWTIIIQQIVDINYVKTKKDSFYFLPGGHIDVILAVVDIKLKKYDPTNDL